MPWWCLRFTGWVFPSRATPLAYSWWDFLSVQQYYVWIGLRICWDMQYVPFTVSKASFVATLSFRKGLLCGRERLVGIPYTVLTWSQLWGLSTTRFLSTGSHFGSFLRWRRFRSFFSSVFLLLLRRLLSGVFLFYWLVWRGSRLYFVRLHGFLSMRGFEYCFIGISWLDVLTGFTVPLLPRRRLCGCSGFYIFIGDVLLASTFHWSCILLACFGDFSLTLGYLIPALRVWFQRFDGWRDVFVPFWMKYLRYSLIPWSLHTAIWNLVCALSSPDEIA